MNAVDHPALVALSAAIENAANLLRVPAEGVALGAMEARDWPDSCLGLPEDDEACAEVVTPGYLIRLSDGFTYRADHHATVGGTPKLVIAPIEIRVRFSVSGGMGGRPRSYETDSYQLPEADEEELRRLIAEANFFDVPNFLLESPVADGITSRLWIAVGRRAHQVTRGGGIDADDIEAFHALAAWVDARTPPLFPEVGNLLA